jgi:hypothetical protein
MKSSKKNILLFVSVLISTMVSAAPAVEPISVSCPRTFSCEWAPSPDVGDNEQWYRCTLDGPNSKYFSPMYAKGAFDGSKLRLVRTNIQKQINGSPRFGVATCEFRNLIDNTYPQHASWESTREWAFERGDTINSTWFYTEGSLHTSCEAGNQCDMKVVPSKDWVPGGWCSV